MSNETRNKIAVLKKSRRRIDKEVNVYVCVAIEDSGDDLGMKSVAATLMQEIGDIFVGDGIEKGATVGEWLHHKHGVDRTDLTYARLRKYRMAWLDSWIGDLEKSIAVDDFPG